VFGILWIKFEPGAQQGAGDLVAQFAHLGSRARLIGYDLQVDVFGHPADETVGPA